ncbi:hypothetical protein ACFORH_35130 [Amycolatopsis roodepoortensis]|uniref:SdpA family antimicrobial peptide system protein n=1 Tax=Amycolatopsis roodepoortensis TaxID=700274 RepID=A0ABR9L265_9PSEU|nr:hypothetical protein [Amycolatopsis roodepoortensis]MBE1574362.1 hypothetical protein [Amycolatopsis roodepoortensis]
MPTAASTDSEAGRAGAHGISEGEDPEQGFRGFVLTSLVLGLGFVLACLAQADLFGISGGLRDRLDAYRVLWPQEWVFFIGLDKSSVVPYRAGHDGRLVRLHEREVWGERLGGLNREHDVYTTEARQIADRIPDRYWQECGQGGEMRCEKVPDPALLYRTENPLKSPTLCGRAVLAIERASSSEAGSRRDGPWAAYRVASVDLRCSG